MRDKGNIPLWIIGTALVALMIYSAMTNLGAH